LHHFEAMLDAVELLSAEEARDHSSPRWCCSH
jgi:hypothetical protein